MSIHYMDFGQPQAGLDVTLFKHEASRELFAACDVHPDIDVVEIRSFQRSDGVYGDIIVVDCGDGRVPSRNTIGIKVRERLALTYCPTNRPDCPYDVRALRVEFPVTLHQNHVLQGEPPSICLYFEPWTTVERTWTPQKHLARILWWLHESASGTLHRSDQPLEHLYFVTPWQLILPPDFHQKAKSPDLRLELFPLSPPDTRLITFGAEYSDKQTVVPQEQIAAECLTIRLSPVVSGPIQTYPYTLGELHQQLISREAGLFNELCTAIINKVPEEGINIVQKASGLLTFILVHVPIIRNPGDAVERIDVLGFVAHTDLVQLGIAAGILIRAPGTKKAYVDHLKSGGFSETLPETPNVWQTIPIEPVDVKFRMSRNYARQASGISAEHAEFKGVLAGVGALGSVLADTWAREAWGNWVYVDDDVLQVHNLARHIGKNMHIGLPKVDVVKRVTELNYADGLVTYRAIRERINNFKNEEISALLKDSDLLIDVTTTLEVPRDLSVLPDVPRMASVFVTPSGHDSVLLLEDKERTINLSSLEAQYYRAILQHDWGENHLTGHFGNLWVGGGCRDISNVISNELIQLHGAILARQIRQKTIVHEAKINIWIHDDNNSCVTPAVIPVYPSITNLCGIWSIKFDSGLQDKLFSLRTQNLPNETGGILLGYIDQKMKAIQLVDVLPAPADSIADTSGFVRGTNGLPEALDSCCRRTANIVTYIGEWHSHPPHASTYPSSLDMELLAYLANQMADEGLPVLMAIVGESELSFTLAHSVA